MKVLFLVFAILAGHATDLDAQDKQPDQDKVVHVIAAAGFARERVIGYHWLAGVESRTPISRVHARVEAFIADFGAAGHTSAAALTVTGAALPTGRGPYLLAGWAAGSDVMGWQRGWIVGAGVRFRLGDRIAFAESRMMGFHDPAFRGGFDDDWRHVSLPATLGLKF